MKPQPPRGVLLALAEDVPDGAAIVVEAGAVSLILTRSGAQVAAFRNVCPHAGYPLQRSDGRILVQEGHLICAAHCASFALDTGACAGGPCNGRGLEKVAIKLRDGAIWTA
jgi:nitrite reductase/ring-hydroxylating ferredoxin subunit